MISNRSTRRSFCYSALLAVIPAVKKQAHCRLPKPKFQIGDRVTIERICDDSRPSNFKGIDWESGFVVGYCWQYDEWRLNQYREGWTYWILFDESNSEILSDRPWLDFVHHSEIIRA